MTDALRLDVQLREKLGGRASKIVRTTGKIPGVIYGHESETLHVAMDRLQFQKVYENVGESSLFDVLIDGKDPAKVLVQDVQRDATTMKPIHVDFYRVKMDEKLRAHVPLEVIGKAPAEKNFGAVLINVLNEIEVECLPGNLPAKITVDISGLKNLEDRIQISDLPIPEGVTVLDDAGSTVVVAETPRTDEELAALDQAVQADVSAVEVAGKKEEEAEEATAETKDAAAPEAAKAGGKPKEKE